MMDELYNLTDETLQALAVQGDDSAEELLVQRFGRLVKASARPLFLAGGDSEDLTQEGMLGLLAAIRTFSPGAGASFQTYAEVCVRRRLLSAVKTASRYKHGPLNHAVSFDSSQFDEISGPHLPRALEEQILSQERADEMHRRFQDVLSPFEHEILRLFLDGLSYQEMAARAGKPVKSVDNAVQRIRKKLSETFPLGEISPG
ncbi:MAG: sigma-70 family RNA polymerase sigma factor [Oscillospiraceae bacterium]|nr:sigma-70 family RNA polymerase sigma factor [Oscillospiraceae bacterium]